ncbi:hypothetical protein GDO78_023003 [Eleutherodactylus coqui]|uniref:Uncharacterized protein n=1 Tax=Eleutherodactylus coqui TaxID=57060 RepID=A0A8J6BGG8_ELECQ|nr:hypothetical protein GDO78_023003 [Eleutherodactylus coqui]
MSGALVQQIVPPAGGGGRGLLNMSMEQKDEFGHYPSTFCNLVDDAVLGFLMCDFYFLLIFSLGLFKVTTEILMRLMVCNCIFAFMVEINFLKFSCPCIYFCFSWGSKGIN